MSHSSSPTFTSSPTPSKTPTPTFSCKRKRNNNDDYSPLITTSQQQKQAEEEIHPLRLASSLQEFVSNPSLYNPRPEWLLKQVDSSSSSSPSSSPSSATLTTSGPEFDPPLHYCIRHIHNTCTTTTTSTTSTNNAIQAAIKLIKSGADCNSTNAKGVTPLIAASTKRQCLGIVQLLLENGANVKHVTFHGTTAVLQASHFGQLGILKLLLTDRTNNNNHNNKRLVEMATYNQTTPLMRACQEGHLPVVKYLIEDCGALPNRTNHQNLTALLLASQRGHANIVKYLLQQNDNHRRHRRLIGAAAADVAVVDMDACTDQNSTSLLLAVKRKHMDVTRVLVERGCELFVQDSKGRTAVQVALYKQQQPQSQNNNNHSINVQLAALCTQEVQIYLLQQRARKRQVYELTRMRTLLQRQRATIRTVDCDVGNNNDIIRNIVTLLPGPLIRSICDYMPIPAIWEERIGLFTRRSIVNPNAAIVGILDVIDEILEEKFDFLQACDDVQVPPPSQFQIWKEWKIWCLNNGQLNPTIPAEIALKGQIQQQHHRRPDVTLATLPSLNTTTTTHSTRALVELRRNAGYLQILSTRQDLQMVLCEGNGPVFTRLVPQLVAIADVCSLVRRTTHSYYSIGDKTKQLLHFEPSVAMDMILLTSRLCSST